MSDTERLLSDTTDAEGYCSHLYICPTGFLSVAIGRNLEANPLTGREWRELFDAGEIAVSISKAGAERLLKSAVNSIAVQCATTFRFWGALNDARQNVMIDLAYNLGLPRLLGFRKMLAALERQDYETASVELLNSLYAKQTGRRAKRNAQILRTGEFP